MKKRFLSIILIIIMSYSFTSTALAGEGSGLFFGPNDDNLETTKEIEDVAENIECLGYDTFTYYIQP